MEPSKKYLIGFDRFVKLDWADYALDLAIQGHSSKDASPKLKAWLGTQLYGDVSIRKTSDLLRRLWIDQNPENENMIMQALKLAVEINHNERVFLHYGMAMIKFDFFLDTVSIIGKMLKLQEDIRTHEIVDRIQEKYGNSGTVPRAVARLLQTLEDWKLILSNKRVACINKGIMKPKSAGVINWLIIADQFASAHELEDRTYRSSNALFFIN